MRLLIGRGELGLRGSSPRLAQNPAARECFREESMTSNPDGRAGDAPRPRNALDVVAWLRPAGCVLQVLKRTIAVNGGPVRGNSSPYFLKIDFSVAHHRMCRRRRTLTQTGGNFRGQVTIRSGQQDCLPAGARHGDVKQSDFLVQGMPPEEEVTPTPGRQFNPAVSSASAC